MSNIKYQLLRELEAHIELGTSKKAARGQSTHGISDAIHSASTARTYMQQVSQYGAYLRSIGQNKATVGESKQFAADYIKQQHSAWSQALVRSALAKVYQCDAASICDIDIRSKNNIVRGRSMTDRASAIEKNHAELCKFCQATGLRKDKELAKLSRDKILITDKKILINVIGKGGKFRTVEVLEQDYSFCKNFIMSNLKNSEDRLKVPHGMNVHKYRSDFAKKCYEYALTTDYKNEEIYTTRNNDVNKNFDKGALGYVNEQLGHSKNRYYTAVTNYLYD